MRAVVFSIICLFAAAAFAQTIPENAESNYGYGWKCKRGFKQVGAKCDPLVLPENSEIDWSGNAWVCKKGFVQRGASCVAVEIPQNAKLDWSGHGWECERGFKQIGSNCEQVSLPPNAKLDWSGHGWECERGYTQTSAGCTMVNIPANAQLDWSGHSWKCNSGYKQIGNGCESFEIPINAVLALGGNDWNCKLNFKKQDASCVPMTPQEIQFQNFMIAQAMACGNSRDVDVSGDCGGENVEGELTVCSNSKEVSGELTFDNGLTTDFDGEWVGAGEIEGSDDFGNSCDLEID